MKNRISSFYTSVPAKLFLINSLICFVFIAIGCAVFFSFPYIKKDLSRIFNKEFSQLVGNAETGRKLAKIVADTNLLMSRYYGREDILKSKDLTLFVRQTQL